MFYFSPPNERDSPSQVFYNLAISFLIFQANSLFKNIQKFLITLKYLKFEKHFAAAQLYLVVLCNLSKYTKFLQ